MSDDNREITNVIAYWNNWCLDKQYYGTHKTDTNCSKKSDFIALLCWFVSYPPSKTLLLRKSYLYHIVIRL